MRLFNWTAVYRNDLQNALLVKSYLCGDEFDVKMVPDVTSPPLQGPGAHHVKNRYTLHVLLVPEDQAKRAFELIDHFLSK